LGPKVAEILPTDPILPACSFEHGRPESQRKARKEPPNIFQLLPSLKLTDSQLKIGAPWKRGFFYWAKNGFRGNFQAFLLSVRFWAGICQMGPISPGISG